MPLQHRGSRKWRWPCDLRCLHAQLLLSLAFSCACTPIHTYDKSSSASGDGTVETVRNSADGAVAEGDDTAVQAVKTGSAACSSREPGDSFCDDDAVMHVCLSATTSRALPCGELERCVLVSGTPLCRCVPGAVLQDTLCTMGTSCEIDNGGCDPLTTCSPDAAGRVCGSCPDGYAGEGLQGCVPQLTMLKPSCGELVPPLAPGVYEYRLRVPLLCHGVTVESEAPANTRLTVNDEVLTESSATWPLSAVKYGETPWVVELSSEFGIAAKYNIVVERTGSQDAYIKASNADAEDRFGFSIAAAGDELFVGAPWEDGASLDEPGDNSAANSGAVYGFVRGADGWVQTIYLKPSRVIAGEAFGTSVRLAGDTLFVGAVGQDPLQWWPAGSFPRSSTGAVYVFTRSNGTWTQTARLTPSAALSGDIFGWVIASHENTLAVGAPGESAGSLPKSGAVYIFQLEAGAWVEKQRLQPPTAPNGGNFGMALALDAGRLLVGAPTDSTREFQGGTAYVFTQPSAGAPWRLERRLDPATPVAESTYGWRVAMAGDSAMIAAPGLVLSGPQGLVHIFDQRSGDWMARDSKAAAFPSDSNLYGGGLALSESVLVVGANGDSSGASGVEADGSRQDAYQSGAVYLYARTNERWELTTYLKASNPDPDDQFGVQVASSPAGVFAAAPYEGSAARGVNGDQGSNVALKSGAVYVFH